MLAWFKRNARSKPAVSRPSERACLIAAISSSCCACARSLAWVLRSWMPVVSQPLPVKNDCAPRTPLAKALSLVANACPAPSASPLPPTMSAAKRPILPKNPCFFGRVGELYRFSVPNCVLVSRLCCPGKLMLSRAATASRLPLSIVARRLLANSLLGFCLAYSIACCSVTFGCIV